MKKFVFIMIVILLSIPVSIAVADWNHYEIDELNMVITIPEGWTVLVRDMDENDPGLDLIGMDREKMLDQFCDQKIYLDALQHEPLLEIIVTMDENYATRKMYDFNVLSEADLLTLCDNIITSDGASLDKDVVYTDYTFYKHHQALFVILNYTRQLEHTMIHGRQYSTTINGQAININMNFGSEISDDSAEILKQAVDSIQFVEVLEKPASAFGRIYAWIKAIAFVAALGGGVFFLISNHGKRVKTKAPMLNDRL